MSSNTIAGGVVHVLTPHIRKALTASPKVLTIWNTLTPLARNEWICFIESAKKQETKDSRLERLLHDLPAGKRRPCCWAGCSHR